MVAINGSRPSGGERSTRPSGAARDGSDTAAGSFFGYSMRVDAATAGALLRLLLIAPLAAVVPLVGALAEDGQLPPDPRLSVALAALVGGLVLTQVNRFERSSRRHRAGSGDAGSPLPPWPAALASMLLWTLAISLANSALPADLGWYGMTLAVPPVVAGFIGRPGFATVVTGAALVGFAASVDAAHQHAHGAAAAIFGFAAYTIAGTIVTSLLARALSRDHDERTCLAQVAVAAAAAATIEAGLGQVAGILARSPLGGRRPARVEVSRRIGTRRARLGLATLTWHDDELSTGPALGDALDPDGVAIDDGTAWIEVSDGGPASYALALVLAGPLSSTETQRCHDHLAGVALQVQSLITRVRALDELDQIGQTDELTGLPTRRAVLSRLELEQAEAGGGRLAVALVALDDIDAYTDRFGPPEGKRLTTDLGTMLSTRIRGTDLVARFDGATFCLVLPTTTAKGAVHLVDELHTWASLLRPGQPVTFSAGVAEWDGDEPVRSLLGRVERALRQAESEGKDRTVVAPSEGSTDDVADPAPTR